MVAAMYAMSCTTASLSDFELTDGVARERRLLRSRCANAREFHAVATASELGRGNGATHQSRLRRGSSRPSDYRSGNVGRPAPAASTPRHQHALRTSHWVTVTPRALVNPSKGLRRSPRDRVAARRRLDPRVTTLCASCEARRRSRRVAPGRHEVRRATWRRRFVRGCQRCRWRSHGPA